MHRARPQIAVHEGRNTCSRKDGCDYKAASQSPRDIRRPATCDSLRVIKERAARRGYDDYELGNADVAGMVRWPVRACSGL